MPLTREFDIEGSDFSNAGWVSTEVKAMLQERGYDPAVIRRLAIATYEAEMNVVLYARRGTLSLRLLPHKIRVEVEDKGPGISDVGLAMQEGYSTATVEMRERGFGAGMGLPNIRRNVDSFDIASELNRGTRLEFEIRAAAVEANL